MWRRKLIWGQFFFYWTWEAGILHGIAKTKVEIRFKVCLGGKHQLCYTGIPPPKFSNIEKNRRKKAKQIGENYFWKPQTIYFKINIIFNDPILMLK